VREYLPLYRRGRQAMAATAATAASNHNSFLCVGAWAADEPGSSSNGRLLMEMSNSGGERLLAFAFLIQFDQNKLGKLEDDNGLFLNTKKRALEQEMHRLRILLNILPAGYSTNLKAGYRISGRGRKLDIRSDIKSTLKCLVKYKINKDLRFVEDFLAH
jgi:hypothetical protein